MSWMEGQLQNNQEALTNAVRSYVKSQADVGKKLTNEEVMADQQHMEDAKSFYMQQAMTAIKIPEMPEPERTDKALWSPWMTKKQKRCRLLVGASLNLP